MGYQARFAPLNLSAAFEFGDTGLAFVGACPNAQLKGGLADSVLAGDARCANPYFVDVDDPARRCAGKSHAVARGIEYDRVIDLDG